MCGIGLVFKSNDSKSKTEKVEKVSEILSKRGPDGTNIITVKYATFIAAVLHIQGELTTYQPYIDCKNNILLWNGEVFSGLPSHVFGTSDTKSVSDLILTNCNDLDNAQLVGDALSRDMSSIHGPYAFIYYHKRTDTIFFGRDPFGRRSLLIETKGSLLASISSTAPFSQDLLAVNEDNTEVTSSGDAARLVWSELPLEGIYSVSMPTDTSTCGSTYHCVSPWPTSRIRLCRPVLHPTDDDSSSTQVVSKSSPEFLSFLTKAVSDRVRSIQFDTTSDTTFHQQESVKLDMKRCDVGVLFSGGIDSVLLAAVLHHTLVDPTQPIELINISFLGLNATSEDSANELYKQSPDRLAAIMALFELQALFPSREWRLVHVDVSVGEREGHEGRVKGLIHPCDTQMDLNIGTAFWFASRGHGYTRTYPPQEVSELKALVEASAHLRHGEEEEGESGPKKSKQPRQPTGTGDDSDVTTSEVNLTCTNGTCKRVFKQGCPFNYCKKCCDGARKTSSDVICPVHRISAKQQAKMDENAARKREWMSRSSGGGVEGVSVEGLSLDDLSTPCAVDTEQVTDNVLTTTDHKIESSQPPPPIERGIRTPYTISCRALLVGIGADEQMAGYGRHRTVFQRGGYSALQDELNMDLTRLWKRNLGRDDRCISDNGREAWFPYLDEGVVGFLQSLPLNEIAHLDLPQGVGDKRILREAACSLGLGQCTALVKRAIQFGTGVAKNTNILYKTSNRKGSGQAKI